MQNYSFLSQKTNTRQFCMENQEIENSVKYFQKQVTNNSYIQLLEKYFLSDKTNDLEKKHKEWCKNISN